jgi:oligoendopeptidase F
MLNNEVEREVIEALVASVTAYYPRISHRYYAIKKKMLDLTVLHYCDRAAPLPGTDRTYTWAESKDIVLKAYNDFSPAIASIAEMALNKWTDALPREGKNSGAFCNPTVPSHHSYVLLNFTGTIRDVQAMAHELGHAIHQTLAASTGIFFFDATDVLAETASFFGEMLTFQSLLKSAKTLPEKQYMLSRKIELSLNNVIRLVAQRVKDLNKLWLDSQREALGPSVQVDSNVASFWAYVPHFIHSPFYVYSYAFSECLVNSLYAVYQKEPEGFQEKYLDMLRAGGTKRHKELLAPFGLDATDPHFWTQGLSVIEGLIDELEAVNAQIAAE